MRVSPTASAPKISARCEIDLSPGTRTRPVQRRPRGARSAGTGRRGSRAMLGMVERSLAWGRGGVHCRPGGGATARSPAGGRIRALATLLTAGIATRQGKHRTFPDPAQGSRTVAKPELGTKRLCGSCGAKFYDLNKDPIVCPKCGTVVRSVAAGDARPRPEAAPAARGRAPRRRTRWWRRRSPEAEFVSLEEADAEAQGKKTGEPRRSRATEDEVEIETRASTTPPSSRSRKRRRGRHRHHRRRHRGRGGDLRPARAPVR